MDVDAKAEARASYLILQGESDELCLAVSEGGGKASGAFKTDGASPVLDVAEVGSGNAKPLGKQCEALVFSFANG